MGRQISKDRFCVKCGNEFRGAHARCAPCRTTDRTCADCKQPFRGRGLKCDLCRRTRRVCTECKTPFLGNAMRCPSCWSTRRICEECGTSFRGTSYRCQSCRATERVCVECERSFKGLTSRCEGCQAVERACDECHRAFRGRERKCGICRWNALPPEMRAARLRSAGNRRRALRRDAQVAGPVPAEVYAAILESGPCVYCGCAAEHVDHVRPLFQEGWEHESNLVPACETCNLSKREKLLDQWIPERVTHGVLASVKVAIEYARVTGAELELGWQKGRFVP